MPPRHPPTDKHDAVVERQLASLRQIPAKIEAAEFMANKFREAGRPLSEDDGVKSWVAAEHASYYAPPVADHTLRPGDGRRGFLVGVAVAAVGLSALSWFFLQ